MNKFKVVCATQLGGSLGMQLWGVAENGRLFSTLQKRPNAPWEEWSECSGAPQHIITLTAASARNGCMSLWALDPNGVLHCTSHTSVGVDNWVWSDPKYGWWPIPREM